MIGLGAMGTAALYHLSKREGSVLGLERFDVPNEMGSSHGLSRIIRLAYHEHPSYVPLLIRAYELWRELEKQSGQRLLHITGSVDAGPPGNATFEGSLESCRLHDLPHEVLTSAELSKRFPGYRLPSETMAVLQPQGGYLRPEACLAAHLQGALANGAEVHVREMVTRWKREGEGARVFTESEEYYADRVVCSTGAWMSRTVPLLREIAVPERQVVAWFAPLRPDYFEPSNFPVFNMTVREGSYYGFPITESPGFKIGRYHHRQQIADPDELDRAFESEDESVLRDCVVNYFPDAAGATLRMQCCMFTNTADEHFILDKHPEFPQVIIASPCSGHGFKFASVIGEILADLAADSETRHDISMFRLKRFL